MLEDEHVEERLHFIRKQTGLDKKFILVLQNEKEHIDSFIQHLPTYLWRMATLYYTTKLQKINRKRTRLQSSSSPYSPTLLRPLGWLIRYECKLGFFTECLGEWMEALTYLTSAYHHTFAYIEQQFHGREKEEKKSFREREAKTLLDVIAFKLIRLYFLLNQPQKALQHLHVHVTRASQVSPDPSMLLPWPTRIYCAMAEFIHLAQTYHPTLHPSYDGLLQVQPAGYWYMNGYPWMKHVKDDALHLRLLTKAYDGMKYTKVTSFLPSTDSSSSSSSPKKMKKAMLVVAKWMAEVHLNSGHYEKALSFLERIAKSYLHDHWYQLFNDNITTMIDCCTQLNAFEKKVDYQLHQIQVLSSLNMPVDHLKSKLCQDLLHLPRQDPLLTIQTVQPFFFNVHVAWLTPTVIKGTVAQLSVRIEAITSLGNWDTLELVCQPTELNCELTPSMWVLPSSSSTTDLKGSATDLNVPRPLGASWSVHALTVEAHPHSSLTVYQCQLQLPITHLDHVCQVHSLHLHLTVPSNVHLQCVYPFSPPLTFSLEPESVPPCEIQLPHLGYLEEPMVFNVLSPLTLPISLTFSSSVTLVDKEAQEEPSMVSSTTLLSPTSKKKMTTTTTHTTFTTNTLLTLIPHTLGDLVCTVTFPNTTQLRSVVTIHLPFQTTYAVSSPKYVFHGTKLEEERRCVHVSLSPLLPCLHMHVPTTQTPSKVLGCSPVMVHAHQRVQCGLLHVMDTPYSTVDQVHLGQLDVQWKPLSRLEGPWITTTLTLPTISRSVGGVMVKADYPKQAMQSTWVSVHFTCYNLHPTTTYLVHLDLRPLHDAPTMFVTGPRQVQCTLLPDSPHRTSWTVYFHQPGWFQWVHVSGTYVEGHGTPGGAPVTLSPSSATSLEGSLTNTPMSVFMKKPLEDTTYTVFVEPYQPSSSPTHPLSVAGSQVTVKNDGVDLLA
ncbi:hypothetical protein HMI56_004883 [Coelomomyces lativittatus]|nr:hypothetical protein HMI56_004883 [Coelomomyces lativittatus]